jgi:glucose dehydrogenase
MSLFFRALAPSATLARSGTPAGTTRAVLSDRLPCALLLLALLGTGSAASGQVSFERVLDPSAEPQNWLSYSRTLDNQRHSPLDQIDSRSVGNLELAWVWQAKSLEKFEATPLVVDGVLYTVQAPNDVVALDAATGRIFWTYHHEPAPSRTCCGRVNRGLAILGNTLFMGTVDSHLLALDHHAAHRRARQGLHRHGGGRHQYSRLRGRLRRHHRQGTVEAPHDSGPR